MRWSRAARCTISSSRSVSIGRRLSSHGTSSFAGEHLDAVARDLDPRLVGPDEHDQRPHGDRHPGGPAQDLLGAARGVAGGVGGHVLRGAVHGVDGVDAGRPDHELVELQGAGRSPAPADGRRPARVEGRLADWTDWRTRQTGRWATSSQSSWATARRRRSGGSARGAVRRTPGAAARAPGSRSAAAVYARRRAIRCLAGRLLVRSSPRASRPVRRFGSASATVTGTLGESVPMGGPYVRDR